MQQTLRRAIAIEGIGLHSGAPVRLSIRPAPAGRGIRFRRTDMAAGDIPALWDAVSDLRLNTTISNGNASVSTIEHLMAALAGMGIHNALVEVNGPEVPILDGSSRPFAQAIAAAGIRELDAPLMVLEVLMPVSVEHGDSRAALAPHKGFTIDYAIEFEDAAIGRQHHAADLANGRFLRDFADCRTFCRKSDVDAMLAQGLARGGSLDNAVVVEGADVLTPGGFRREDECVRHKMLDALGDLALAGAPILGAFTAVRGGHRLTNMLLRELMSRRSAWRMRAARPEELPLLPGMALTRADLAAVG